MAEHIWRFHNGWEHPKGRAMDTDGWDVCIACGANDRTEAEERQIQRYCPGDRPTPILCTCTPPVHTLPGVDHRP
jgi:hypothetical protein